MSKNNLTENQKKLYEKLLKLSKTTKVRPKQIQNDDSYQFSGSDKAEKEKTSKIKKNKRWVLINNNCELVGRLDYNPENTRASARKWFYNTKKMVNQHGNFDKLFKVLTTDEFDELQKIKPDKDKSRPTKLKNDEKSDGNDGKRLRFASKNASIYTSSSIITINSRTESKEEENTKFLEFLSRAPITFGDNDE
ncbi:hypothetical protein N9N24_03665 [Candidatus Marinimicrobia bacterium]|nr:hypothetical protein [Candidatus Neomarinimicrobiota bacterium]